MVRKYRERILEVYPDLSIAKCQPIDTGQNNDVLVINQSLVFRFPKYKVGIAHLQKETKILEYVQPLRSLPIPNPIYRSFDPLEVGKVFTGYRFLPGTPLWEESLTRIENDDVVQGLASQLAAFLLDLHSISTDSSDGFPHLEDSDPREEMYQLYHGIQTKLFPFMRKEAQEEVSVSFETFLNRDSSPTFRPALIHGDFGASNILWEPETCRISGIVDFGGSGLGDPAYDFAGLWASYGEAFLDRCVSLYPDGNEIADRARFYRSTFALQEALHGFDNGDKQAFENGIQAYR
ncbi:phosphotransferase family protein [Cohnella nanjingensis]|uniref:Aminoglycoside phosphotransferase family protein n=1 Tax=Cohnella nanjingensis TaxID=1387779 RepID=A0A7X0RXT4_9BACL|nr:aminoglycoside phosphotransferase family protein [Cohnella nanjingensis]MBB6675628.1 aminoglycoside phosphotransferase family protein [Cohnella nanjingensis]